MVKTKVKTKKKQYFGSDKVFNTVLLVLSTILMLSVLYPIIFILSSSFSSGQAVNAGKIILWPVEFTTIGYELILSNKNLWHSIMMTLFYILGGGFVCMALMILVAYPMSRKNFQGRTIYQTYFLIPMWVSGGLIPSFILTTQLGLFNSIWNPIIGAGFNIYGMVIVRTYFTSSVPGDLLEAAKMDGITDFGYLLKILLPLSKPVLIVQALNMALASWNSYMGPMIYLRDKELWPIQLVIREILQKETMDGTNFVVSEATRQLALNIETMRYSTIVITTFPFLIIFMSAMKYFKKGMMVGSMKG